MFRNEGKAKVTYVIELYMGLGILVRYRKYNKHTSSVFTIRYNLRLDFPHMNVPMLVD